MNSVPPSATSNSPGFTRSAPVNDPRSCPNSSLSSSDSCSVAQFTVTSGLSRRGLFPWTARATSSFPVPLGPRTSTVASVGATFSIRASTFRSAGLAPTMWYRGDSNVSALTTRRSWEFSRRSRRTSVARSRTGRICWRRNGLRT